MSGPLFHTERLRDTDLQLETQDGATLHITELVSDSHKFSNNVLPFSQDILQKKKKKSTLKIRTTNNKVDREG